MGSFIIVDKSLPKGIIIVIFLLWKERNLKWKLIVKIVISSPINMRTHREIVAIL